jgi:pimeloyl-ACP methyl ester carboxylesterase
MVAGTIMSRSGFARKDYGRYGPRLFRMRVGMISAHRLRKWGIAAGALIICALLANPISHLAFSVRLALSLQKMTSGADEQSLAIREATIHRRMGTQSYDALLYYPEKSRATKAIILVAGLSELGCRHPRLIAFSRLLANKGLLVITPDIREFRNFQITAEPINQILFWYNQVPRLEGGEKIQSTGLAGISFSGTLALMAAARPEIRDSVGFVACIGPYSSLIRCTRGWFAAGPVTVQGNHYPTRFYARWLIMLAALNMLPSESDRQFLHSVLDNLLLQRNIPPASPDLTPAGVRWYALATMREDQSDPEISKQIETYLVSSIYPQLDPESSLGNLRCPAFIMHGAYDDLISPDESRELHQRISNSYLLISPFLTHTHPVDTQLSWKQKANAALKTIIFCYHFSRAIR